MARGNGGQDIVTRSGDWRRLLEVVARVKKTSDFKLYAYCLMTNHFHVLVGVAGDPLSHFMHRIQTTWAKRFNIARKRRGHVFQDRFKSKPCGDDTDYCRWLLRYIHVNPVNAGMVPRPEDWEWSSYRQFLGYAEGIADTAWPLSLFGEDRSSFSEFVLQGIGEPDRPFQLEDSRTVQSPAAEGLAQPAEPAPLAALLREAAAAARVSIDALVRRGRSRSVTSARRRLAARAVSAGYRATEIARLLCVSPSAVSQMIRAERDCLIGNEQLK